MAKRPAPGGETLDGISLQNAILQFSLMSLVFYLWTSPLIQPVKIMVVLFHEMSHGLTALLSGGKVVRIWITADEGGACETEGGMALLIVSAGYLGSMLFGGLLLYLSRFRKAAPAVFGGLTLVLLSAVVTVMEDSYTRTFTSILAGACIVIGFLSPGMLGGLFLRAIGTVSCLYSIFDIYWDVLADRGGETVHSDAVIFAELSGASARTVGLWWLVASVAFFLFALKLTLRAMPRASSAPVEGGAPARA